MCGLCRAEALLHIPPGTDALALRVDPATTLCLQVDWLLEHACSTTSRGHPPQRCYRHFEHMRTPGSLRKHQAVVGFGTDLSVYLSTKLLRAIP